MESLLNQELKNQENAKSGNKHPSIQVVTDPNQIALLRQDIEAKMEQSKRALSEAAQKKGLAETYKTGNKTIVPEIISILKSTDESKKKDLLRGLCKHESEDADNYSITEQAIIDLVLNDVDNPVFEKEAVQLAGINALPGYENKFETRLLSGNSTDAGRIFFWLGKEAKSHKALAYITMQIRGNKVSQDEVNGIISGLEGYGTKGDPAMKTAVGNLALTIYQKKLITDARIEELKNSAYTSDAAEGLLTCLFEYGDKQVIPIANNILERKIRVVGPIKALVRLEGPQHLEKIYRYLRSQDDFFTGLDIAESIDKRYVDDKMLKEILIQFSKRKNIPDDQIDRIVRSFIALKAENYLKNSSAIVSNADVAGRIKKGYALMHISSDLILTDLINSGLIGKKPDTAAIRKATEEASNDPMAFVYGILESQNIYLSFDTETDFLPVDYDKLLRRFSEKSAGLLKDMLIWLDVKENKSSGGIDYVITVLYKNNAFIARPEDVGDWYDVMTVNALLEKILERSGSQSRFVSIETGDQTVQYIFGIPGTIQGILKKYKV